MTFDEFFTKYNGVGIDADHVYGNQCVDLIKSYFAQVLGLPFMTGNAIDYWTNYPAANFDRIVNTITAVPQKGDIMIWDKSTSMPYGHISICTWANLFWFVSFDQNWPTQGYTDKNGDFIGTGVCHLVNHNYLRPKVLGWLRFKK